MGEAMIGRIIQSSECVAEGAAYLADLDPKFARALELTGQPPLRRRADGFEALFGAIVSQQVSVASAAAIWSRLKKARLTEQSQVNAATDEDLRSCGMSRQKIKYAQALADAGIDFESLRSAPDDDVISTLVAVSGIGPWTAEIYAMFSLGRADVFAPGDLALQEATRILFDLDERPKEKALREMAKAWTPWQGVAARILFAYYHIAKEREGIR